MELRIGVAETTIEMLKGKIRDIPDFPKQGILFKDITPLINDPRAFAQTIDALAALVPEGTSKILAIESRGFILGSAIAVKCGLGLAIARKPGKLPYKTLSHSYDLEYGKDALQIHSDAFAAGEKVCVVDDVLATGGTAAAAEALCRQAGAEMSGHVFLMEITALEGRKRLKANPRVLISY